MIDLEKEREAFEDAYQHHSFIKHVYRAGNHYSVMPNLNIAKDKKKIIVDLANSSWNAWQRCSLRAQEEITELKQKLARYENPNYVLVQKSEFHTWYFDEYEGLWLDRDGIDGKLSQIDAGQVVEVRKQKQYSIEMPSVFVTLPWLDEDFDYWQEYATKEEAEKVAKHCKQMFEAVEKGNE